MLLIVCFLTGCGSTGYYYQSAAGQLDLMSRARDIEDVLKDEQIPQSVRDRLEQVVEIRRFASEALRLPDNESYRSYADLEREYAIWNVFAAPKLSTQAHRWCFPIVGCVVYRGYFKESDARQFAETLQEEQGLETFVAGVPAYSTLGWFDDPVTNTVLDYSETELAGLIFHELAHQVAYAKDDSVFNESFATTVEIEGVEHWLENQGKYGEIQDYRIRRQRDMEVVKTILAYRDRLEKIYESDHDAQWMLDRKAETIKTLKERYASMVREWQGYRGYKRWFSQDLNNAHFVAIAAYYDKVPAFEALFARYKGDWEAFYAAVVKLSRLPEARRNEVLDKSLQEARID